MSLETALANNIIKNNKISHSTVITSGVGQTIYGYDHDAYVEGSALIEGNTFVSVVSDAILGGSTAPPENTVDILSIKNGSCIVRGNRFIRNTFPINSYIRQYGTGDHIITNNIFDHSTIDGTSDVLVYNLSATSIYQYNKNQTIYISVPLFNSGFSVNPTSISTDSFVYDTNTGDPDRVNPLDGYRPFTYLYSNAAQHNHRFYINLNGILPLHVKISEAKVGMFCLSGTALDSTSSLSINLMSQTISIANYASGTNSILDAENKRVSADEIVSVTYDIDTNVASMAVSTQFITISAGSNNFVVNANNSIGIGLYFNIDVADGNNSEFVVSPLVFKCIW